MPLWPRHDRAPRGGVQTRVEPGRFKCEPGPGAPRDKAERAESVGPMQVRQQGA
jgi:hypothetical protein